MITHYTKNSYDSIFSRGTEPRLLYVGKSEDSAVTNFRSIHHHDNYFEMLLIQNGECNVTIDNICYNAKAGDIVCYNCGTMHHEQLFSKEPFNVYDIAVDGLQFDGLRKNCLVPDGVPCVFSAGNKFDLLNQLFVQTYSLFEDDPATSEFYFHYLTLSIISIVKNIADHSIKTQAHLNRKTSEVGNAVREYLHAHYAKPITLEDIGKDLSLSPYYISHVFKSTSGYSPMQYVTHLRISNAQNLLIYTTTPITEIAYSVGYSNLSNFNYAFSKYSGMSPSQFRKEYTQLIVP